MGMIYSQPHPSASAADYDHVVVEVAALVVDVNPTNLPMIVYRDYNFPAPLMNERVGQKTDWRVPKYRKKESL